MSRGALVATWRCARIPFISTGRKLARTVFPDIAHHLGMQGRPRGRAGNLPPGPRRQPYF
eukprot:15442724-Alexandrium_andersonii.AAC.1